MIFPSPTIRILASAAMIAGPALCAHAEAVDCDKLIHSTVPYEVTMKVESSELKYQVLRTNTLATTLLIRGLDGNITKLDNEGTFPKSITMANGQTATFEYSVPTTKSVFDQRVKQIDTKMKHGADVLLDTKMSLEYLPDEKITVGSCTFDTKHYVQTTSQNGRESRNEIWFSPELEFGIKGVSSLKVGDQQISKKSQASDITTSFTPFK